uniref:DNA 3'-5' helicase n=1 Tax=Chromera velia CCMP2878 TaxID=1169474 RepID=A0A0G4F450_9ALVE|eukprot:Cvel_14994.t1-p1 / transcript=Cvel_14994.t1 / gene=Cvel_14994 / organism=Chromera_velia_CCMP2878 / gene_product=ATP-dependent DNA helicase Q-like 3, putative / transcript_product=ATP-dependent DNA helicase Q-like 3, putative / location=Cvel_scaffold1091:58-1069(-) / protein_length=227 / sequence_SO=supercontig / SO=protein_coding / is_pseudo=false
MDSHFQVTSHHFSAENAFSESSVLNQEGTREWVQKITGWEQEIQEATERTFGFDRLRDVQRGPINAILSRKDVVVRLPTGGGKSLIFQLPAVLLKKVVVVVSPLISLMIDQLEKLKEKDIAAAVLSSKTSSEERARVEGELRKDSPSLRVVYLTPEGVQRKAVKDILKGLSKRKMLTLIAIDEAHCISTWGPDFRPKYLELKWMKEQLEDVPVVALTASATPKVTKQ